MGATIPLVLGGAIAALLASVALPQEPVPTFRVGVDAVLVDVLALDREGKPVEDLRREDFEIREDGVRQEIATFDVTDWTSYVAARTEAPPGGESVNAYPRRFVFIVNRQGAKFEYLNRAKRALGTFLVESMAEGDEAMVVDVGYSMKVVQEFRSAKEETLQAVRKLSQMEIDYPMGADRAAGQFYRDLESLARSLAALPGRKVVIVFSNELLTFVSPGTTMMDQGFALEAATRALNQANASVYTIDVRGPEGFGMSIYGGLSPLATETGGRFFRNQTSFEPPLRRIGRENQRYYLLSYVSTNGERDGTYRKIDVAVARENVEIIARTGYFARPPEVETPTATGAQATAAGSPARAPRAELPLAVELTTYLLPTGAGPVRVPLSVTFPEELLEGRGGSERKAEVTVTGAGGTEVESFAGPVSVERFYLQRNLDLEPGSYEAHVALRSEEQEIYRTSIPFRIPAGLGERFGLSSVIPVVAPGASAEIGDELPILPTTSVKRGESLHVVFQVFAGREDPVERVRVRYRILDSRNAEVWKGSVEREIALSERSASTPVLLSLPTRTLAFGRHRVEVRVEDAVRGRGATSELEFRVR